MIVASDFEILTDVVREQLADDTIAWGVFRVADSEKDSPRRVVWVPTHFKCEGPMQANAIHDADTGELGDTLLTDRLLVECNISGVDFEDGCKIRSQVLNAVREAFGTSSIALDGEYRTEMPGHSGVMWGGAVKIVQRFEWMINVPKTNGLDGSGSGSVKVVEIDLTDELQSSTGSTATDGLLVILPPGP